MVLMRNDVLYIKKPGSILQFKIIFLQNKQHYNLRIQERNLNHNSISDISCPSVAVEHPGHSEISINYYYVYRGGRLYFWTIKADSQANNCRG